MCKLGTHREVRLRRGQLLTWAVHRETYRYKVCIVFHCYQGHIETIFDCQFHPDDPDVLATGSFDGTVKIWDMTTLKPVM